MEYRELGPDEIVPRGAELQDFDTLADRLDQSKDGTAWRKDRALIRQVQKTAKRMLKNEQK